MPTSLKFKKQALRQTLAPYLASGYFSHAYAATGLLTSAEPLVSVSHSPDAASIFDLASLSKALVTAPLVLAWLDEKGQGSSLGDLWTAAGRPWPLREGLKALPLDQILAHTSGLAAWHNFWLGRLGPHPSMSHLKIDALEHIGRVLARAPYLVDSSRGPLYSDIGFILMGALLSAARGRGLAELVVAKAPSNESSAWLGYAGVELPANAAVPTGYCALRGRFLRGEVHDENAAALGGLTGHAGLFANGPGLIQWLKVLWSLPEAQLIRSAGLGWRRGDDPSAGGFGEGRAIGHLGFTGTAFWVDPKFGRYGVLLTNRVMSGRVTSEIKKCRSDIFAIFQSVYD